MAVVIGTVAAACGLGCGPGPDRADAGPSTANGGATLVDGGPAGADSGAGRPPTSRCGGDAEPCGAFVEGSCDSQLGCTWTGALCVGVADDCADLVDEADCSFQSGCAWSP